MSSPAKVRVLLLGDSICMSPGYSFAPGNSGGYAPLVAERLAPHGIAVTWTEENGGSTRRLLDTVTSGTLPVDVDLVHFNAGLHDIATHDEAQGCTVPVEEYQRNLQAIVEAFRARTRANLIWAATTPVVDQLHRERKGFVRRDQDVRRYNDAAAGVMRELSVPVHDLHAVLAPTDPQETLGPDGAHPTAAGRALLATAVSERILSELGEGTEGSGRGDALGGVTPDWASALGLPERPNA